MKKFNLYKIKTPLIELQNFYQKTKNLRPIGLGKELIKIPDGFFEPLPKAILDSFSQPKT